MDPRQFWPLPQRPSVEVRCPGGRTIVGVCAADEVEVEVDRMVVLGMTTGGEEVELEMTTGGEEVELETTTGGDEVELGTTTGTLLEVPLLLGPPGMPGIPRQAPNCDWQPAPQYSSEDPHQKWLEQHGP